MVDIDYDALIADRAAGTPGTWMAVMCDPESGEENYDTVLADAGLHGVFGLAYINHFFSGHEANARRIARLPDLEAAVLALREENQRLQLAVLAAEARGLERAAVVAASDVPKDCGWGPGAGIAVRIRALITPEMRAALEQEQGK